MMRPKRTLFSLLFAIIIGVGFLVFSHKVNQLCAISEKWPTVTRTVIDSSERTGKHWSWEVTYIYTANGSRFNSNQVHWGQWLRQPWKNQDYPKGKEVTVYFNPIHPNIAVLEPGNKFAADLSRKFGIFTLIAFPFLLIVRKVYGDYVRTQRSIRA